MSDRIAVMREGVVEQLADPREIYERPANEFVAGFIGTSNVLKGTIQEVTGGTAVLALSPVDRILVPVDGTVSAGDAITMTVRPEKIMISTEQPEGDLSVVRGTVSEVVYLGTYNSYTVALADGAEVTVFQQNAHDSSVTAERGDTVWLSWQPRHSYVLR